MHLYTILWEIYRVVRGKRLEIHSTKVYNMLRAVMILHTIVRKSMIKFNKKRQVNRMDGCDSHGRSCSRGWKLKSILSNSRFCLS